jgi:hypothetical protein
MDSETLRPLLTTRGPFASVYFEGSHDTQDAVAHLDVRWRGLREQLVEQGAARSVTADIERAVMDLRPPIGRRGRGLIAGADGVVVNEHLLRPPAATVVRVSELPYIVPIVEHGLPERIAERAVPLKIGARHSGHDFDEVQQDIDAQFLKQRLDVIDDVAQRFEAEVARQSGLAAEGLGAVCSALRQCAVATLLIGDIGEATVVADEDLTTIAPNADVLSKQVTVAFGPNAIVVAEQAAAAAKTRRADEALPLFAVSIGASLVRTDERIAPADGVGAVLRYPVYD